MDNREGSVKPADNDSIERYRRRSSRHLIIRLAGRLRAALHILYPLTAITLFALAAGCGPGSTPVWPSVTVNSTGDEVDFIPGDGTCRIAAGSSVCTLRAAIQETNAAPGAQTILFDLPEGVQVIQPAYPLPSITANTVLDGTSQPGYDGITPVVIVDGSSMNGNGFSINQSAGLFVKAVDIRNFNYGIYSYGFFNVDHSVIHHNEYAGIVSSYDTYQTITNSIIRENGLQDPSIPAGGLWVKDGTVTITHSTFADNTGFTSGAIYIQKGEVRLNGSTLTGNVGWDAGGVYVAEGADNLLWIKDGTRIGKPGEGNISGVLSEGAKKGGGIYSEADVILKDSFVEGNSGAGIQIFHETGLISLDISGSEIAGNSMQGIDARNTDVTLSASEVRGNGSGGIYTHLGTLSVLESSVTSNENGGGIVMEGGHLVMTDATVALNTNAGPGGGIFAHNLADANIAGSTISGNSTTEDGGGLYLQTYGLIQIINSTISGNKAAAGGGGLSAGGGDIRLNYVTLANNQTGDSSAIKNSANLTIANSILAQNGASNCHLAESPVSLGHNLSDDSSCVFAGAGDINNQNAQILPLHDNGGPTLTHALMNTSPAVNNADDAMCPASDQRGIARPFGPHCDRGAYELEENAAQDSTPAFTETPLEPTATPTTGANNKYLFDPVEYSDNPIFHDGKTCTSKQVTIRVKVSPAELIKSVGLFYRLETKTGDRFGDWGGGLAMIPEGGGWYRMTLNADEIPDIRNWREDTILAIQFVANDDGGAVLARSPVHRELVISLCLR
ncbi:MAG: right-handed parallel beta-helix repeat-containing protein [Anaerolineales bacterium]